MEDYDLVIIGGGPAGSTIASLVKRYAPHLKVLLLEKSLFPRHHVGESMLAGSTPILVEMEAYDKINAYGFIEKLGASYVWGHDRKPWGFEFDEIVHKFADSGKKLPEIYIKAWQVRRGEYDKVLLDHAQAMGVAVRQNARVRELLRDTGSERVTGVKYSDARGQHVARCSWLMDCTGQDAFIGRELKLREYDDQMNNYALFAYWEGARWKFEYLGHPNHTRIFVATTPHGWIWYIPVSQQAVSVGFVTHRQTLKEMSSGYEQLYREEIASCEEIADLLKDARLVRIATDQKQDICAIQDWSYTSREIVGPGWAMAGDAAGFVDPILSSGVMLAHELGQKAAYTIVSAFASSSDAQIAAYWKFYENTYREYLQAYRDMARFWYSNNFTMQSWWWQAQHTLAQQKSNVNLNSREAFTRVAFGYATRAESLSLFGSFPLQEAERLVSGLFGDKLDYSGVENTYTDRYFSLKEGTQLTDGMYYYRGQVRTTRRIVGSDQQYLDLHPGEEVFVGLLDGKHTLDDLNTATRKMQSLHTTVPVRNGTDLVVQLDNIGVLEVI